MSRPVLGRWWVLTTRLISFSICWSSTQWIPWGAVCGSAQLFTRGRRSLATTAPPNVDAYAAGPWPSRYWPLIEYTLVVLWLSAATSSRNRLTSAS